MNLNIKAHSSVSTCHHPASIMIQDNGHMYHSLLNPHVSHTSSMQRILELAPPPIYPLQDYVSIQK
eukprot:c24344_g3_i1 orf=384-581(-)